MNESGKLASHRRLGAPFYAAMLSALAAIVVIALASSNIVLTPKNLYALEETSTDERATENSFFDSLAAKDAAKSHHAVDGGSKSRHNSRVRHTHAKAKSASMKTDSFRGQFELARRQLEKAKAKMHHMEEKDRVQAEKQTIKMERLSAHEQAVEYERHLSRLSNSVFPSSTSSLDDPADAVRDALVDDIHASSKPAIASLRAKARRTIQHAEAARKAAHHAAAHHAGHQKAAASTSSASNAPSGSIMDSVRQAGEALEKRASDALFSASSSSAVAAAKVAHPAAKLAPKAVAAARAHGAAVGRAAPRAAPTKK